MTVGRRRGRRASNEYTLWQRIQFVREWVISRQQITVIYLATTLVNVSPKSQV